MRGQIISYDKQAEGLIPNSGSYDILRPIDFAIMYDLKEMQKLFSR